jgi:hypothetical protein
MLQCSNYALGSGSTPAMKAGRSNGEVKGAAKPPAA